MSVPSDHCTTKFGQMKDIDWKVLLPVAGITLVAGIAVGAFVVKPALDKAKAKKLAAKKGGSKSAEGTDKKA